MDDFGIYLIIGSLFFFGMSADIKIKKGWVKILFFLIASGLIAYGTGYYCFSPNLDGCLINDPTITPKVRFFISWLFYTSIMYGLHLIIVVRDSKKYLLKLLVSTLAIAVIGYFIGGILGATIAIALTLLGEYLLRKVVKKDLLKFTKNPWFQLLYLLDSIRRLFK